MVFCRRAGAVKAGAICILLLLLPAVGLLPVAAQAPEPEEPVTIEQEGGGGPGNSNGTRGPGNSNGTRGGGRAGGGAGGGGSSGRKLASSIDCQICEATCRVKCLINNLFQWGGCYQRCKTDNCNDWCR